MKIEVINGKWTVNRNTFQELNQHERNILGFYLSQEKLKRELINN